MKSKKVNIKGTVWKFRIISEELFTQRHPENSNAAAITCRHERVVDILPDEVSVINIRHELLHCYVWMCMIEDSDLNKDQMEELCCNIIGEHGEELNKLARKIFNSLRKG